MQEKKSLLRREPMMVLEGEAEIRAASLSLTKLRQANEAERTLPTEDLQRVIGLETISTKLFETNVLNSSIRN